MWSGIVAKGLYVMDLHCQQYLIVIRRNFCAW